MLEESAYATQATLEERNARVAEENAFVQELLTEVRRVIVGQQALLEGLVIGLLSDGHVLLEGVPGLAKTLAVRSLAAAIDCDFQRIQFTPDLLPADLVGTTVYHPQRGEFAVHKGPVFTNLLLADEINRAPAKVQSALLEAMQEKQVTLGETTHRLAEPFLVLATQNPIEHEGTYPLPEAQVDRFMLKPIVTYPTREQERIILDRMSRTRPAIAIDPVMHPDAIAEARHVVDQIYLDDKIKEYIVDLVLATREPARFKLKLDGLLQYGASPRATIFLALGAKANAFLEGRGYVVPQDVKDIAPDVLRHRVIVSYEAEAEDMTSETIVRTILDHVPVP